MNPPLHAQRYLLPLVGVLLTCLDERGEPLPNVASGFIRRENGHLFLYTCWHVVTGFDPYDVQVGLALPRRRYLRVSLQDAQQRQPGVVALGGRQTVDVPLYETTALPSRPRWLQDDRHIPHPDLNPIGLYIPFWHDVIKLELPSDLHVSELQLIDETRILLGTMPLAAPGDKCLVVGYPHGFSSLGPEHPTPVVLTRFIASTRLANRRQNLLLDGAGAPGMSGGPVFIEREEELLLFGVYAGAHFPDLRSGAVTSLGRVTDLSLIIRGTLPLVATPSEADT